MTYDPLIDAIGILHVLRVTMPLLPVSEERNAAWTTLDNAATYLITMKTKTVEG